MEHYVGLDVSLELTSVCLVDASGQVVRVAKVKSKPDALIHFLRFQDLSIARVALEAGPLSQWLHAGLSYGRGAKRVSVLGRRTIQYTRCSLPYASQSGFLGNTKTQH